MYIVVKKGVYDHGVMWIGSDIDEGKKKADYLASNKDDGYHDYQLRKFVDPAPYEPLDEFETYEWVDRCEVVYTGIKTA